MGSRTSSPLESGPVSCGGTRTRRWTPHVLIAGIRAPINASAYDVDGDGIPEIALAHGFANDYASSPGIVSILTHGGDPTAPWTAREIDRLPTSHRLRFVDIDGTGKRVLVNAPLIGSRATAPDYRDHVPLVMYRPGEWKREVIDDGEQGVVHGIVAIVWNGDTTRVTVEREAFSGSTRDGSTRARWTRTKVADGDPGTVAEERIERDRRGTRRPRVLSRHDRTVARQPSGGVSATRRRLEAPRRRRVDCGWPHDRASAISMATARTRSSSASGRGRRSVYLYRLTNAARETRGRDR